MFCVFPNTAIVRRWRLLFFAACAASMALVATHALAAPATAEDKAAFVRQAIATYFIPRIDAWGATTAPLVESIDALCKAPGREMLTAARGAFVKSLLAWETATAISYGPITSWRSIYKLDFWPVRMSLLTPLLAKPPATVTEMEAVGGPAKGYPALEWILWTPADNPAVLREANHCRYALVVAMEIAAEAQGLEKEFASRATQEIPLARADEYFSELLGVVLGALQKLGVKKIEKPSYVAANKNYPRTLSGQTAAEWSAQWAGLRSFLVGDGTKGSVDVEAFLRAHGQAATADKLRAAVNRVSASLASGRATTAVGRKAGKELGALRDLYTDNVADALGITIEFDENDGD